MRVAFRLLKLSFYTFCCLTFCCFTHVEVFDVIKADGRHVWLPARSL